MIKKILMLNLFLFVAITITIAQPAKNLTHTLNQPAGHYEKLSQLDNHPDLSRKWLDTIYFPAKEITTSILAATKMRTVYLIDDVPSLLKMPDPPANSSLQTRAELDYMLELQEKRTPREVERYKKLAGIFHSPNNFNPHDPDYDRNFSSLFHVGSPFGDWYNYKNLPFTAKFLSDVYRDATYYFFNLKLSINRARPYMLEPRLKFLERPPHPSYPSGHSAASYINAYVLSAVAPELAEEFLKMAAEMAFSREVIGVHFPSDSEQARVWAGRFVQELFKKEKFRQDLEKVKNEILGWQQSSKKEKPQTGDQKECRSSCESSCSSSCGSGSSCCNEQ